MVQTGAKNRMIWLLIAIQACLLVFFAFYRLVDNDEGFYLSAAHEVARGQTVYTDFFYPQMPYLPYIFSVLAGHGFTTLYLSRLASVAVSLLASVFLYLIMVRLTADRTVIALLMAGYVFSGLAVSMHSVAETYAWTNVFLVAALYFLVRFDESRKLWLLMVCGALVALAVNVRLMMAPLILVYLIRVIVVAKGKRLSAVLAYGLSGVVVSLPSLYLLALDTRRYVFDNFGFHLIRNPGVGFPGTVSQRLTVIGKLLINPQVLLVLAALIVAVVAWRRAPGGRGSHYAFTSISRFAGIVMLVIVFIHLLPDPIHQRYFVQALPFALLAVPGGVEYFLSRARDIFGFITNRRLAHVLTAIYILGMIPYFVVFIGAVRECDGHTNIANLKRICACLNNAAADGPILAELPMVSVLSNKATVDGIEFLGFEYILPINDADKRYYRFVLNRDLKKILETRQASHYVVVNDPPEELAEATAANYRLAGTFERFKVYRRMP